MRQNRKCESGGFSGAGLGGANQIFAGENNGEGAKLDGVGSAKPIACTPRTTSEERSKLLNDTGRKLTPRERFVILSETQRNRTIPLRFP